MFQVLDLTLSSDRQDRLLGFEVDTPAIGHKGNTYVLHMIGWAVGRDARALSLEVVENGRVVRVVPIRGPRADVSESLSIPPDTDCVFHALVDLVGLHCHTTLTLQVELDDGSRAFAGSVTVARDPLRTAYEPKLAPLIVTTLGRSGSTWLMQMLASHPEVVTFRKFPYESAPAKYWIHLLRALSEPGNLVQSAEGASFHDNHWWIGANPFHDDRLYEQAPLEGWWARTHVESLAVFVQKTIDDWYLTLARVQDQPGPVYFAEKHIRPNYLPVLTWELYPRAKEVFLVRDFRDMARSILGFDERRGYFGFGREGGTTDEQYLRGEVRAMVDTLEQAWRERRDRAHLVRYEDLVLQPEETVASMLRYLELDASPGTVSHVLEHGSEKILSLPGASYDAGELEVHRTFRDPAATVGRWRREADPALVPVAEEVFGDALEEFGYR